MRRILPVLVLASSAAHAELPLYNTDMLARGEAAATWSLSLSRLEAEAVYTPAASAPLPGRTDTTTRAGAIDLLLGLGDRLNGRLSFAFTEQDLDARFRGAGTPSTVDLRAGERGEEDLGVGLEYRLSSHATYPLVARLAVLIPTASDYPGTQGLAVNGTPLSVVEDGGRGSGYTRFFPALGGSVQTQAGALEWDLRLETDDEKGTEDRYALALGWLQRLGADGFVRVTGSIALQQGMQAANGATDDSEDYALTLTGGYNLTPNVRVTAICSVGWLDDLQMASGNGSVIAQSDRVEQSARLGIAYMLP